MWRVGVVRMRGQAASAQGRLRPGSHSCACLRRPALPDPRPPSPCPFSAEDNANGGKENAEVEAEAAMLDVVEVVSELGAGILDGGTVGVVDLGPAGDARPNAGALAVMGDEPGQLLDEGGPLRTGAD